MTLSHKTGITIWQGRWIVLILSFIWLLVLHHNVLFHPDDYVFSGRGDGLKNYYTFVYHVKHDDSWLKFGGNNYPYGEHVCYTDGHPIVSLVFGSLPWVKNHPVGFLNLLMLLSIPFTSLVLYELLRMKGVRIALCIAGALCINWLNPQIYRFLGHLALSYAWIIPLGLILIHQYRNNFTRSWWSYYFFYCLVVWMIHPYLGFALALLAGSNFMVEGIHKLFTRKLKWKWTFQVVMMTFLPLVVYLTFIKLTDTHINRPPDAKGYLEYSASYECLFVPNHAPFRNMISQVIKVHTQSWEGWSYLGLSTMIVLLLAMTFFLKSFGKFLSSNIQWVYLIVSSSLVALFACGFPFKQGNQHLLDVIPYIEQFRAPGRFAWILYYTLTVLVFVLVDKWIERINGKKIPAYAVCSVVVILFAVEGYSGQHEVAGYISETRNMYNPEFLTESDKTQLEKLNALKQKGKVAILPVPFFHYGSDYYLFEGSQESKRDAHTLSFHAGIPMLANVNPRVSLSESRSLIQIVAPSIFEKDIWKNIDPDMEIYIVRSEGDLRPEELKFLGRFGDTFTFREQQDDLKKLQNEISSQAAKPDSIAHSYYYYNTFDHEPGGRKSGTTIPFIRLDTLRGEDLIHHKKWIASAWLYFTDPDAQTTALTVEKYRGDSVVWVGRTHVATSYYQFSDSVFVEVPFETEPGYNYRIFSKGSETDWADISFDHLMVRADTAEILIREGKMIRRNGGFCYPAMQEEE